MSEDNGLPSGWAKVSLAEIGTLHCGQSPSVSEVNRDGRGTPYVTGPDQWDGSTLKVDKWTINPKRIVPDGCIFITVKGAGVGTLFAGVACAIGRDVYAYEPSKDLPRKFTEHSLRYNILEVLRHVKGDIPGLSKDHILGHITAFPPLNEQRRIVARIEELFSNLDAGVAALKRAKANLKRYRAAVLKAAVEGTLTAEWRAAHPDAEPAATLLARILSERRQKWQADQLAKFAAAKKEPPKGWQAKYVEPKGPETSGLPKLPEGWCWASVEQICDIGTGTTPSRTNSRFYNEGRIPWVMSSAVNRPFIDEASEFVTEYAIEETTLRLYPIGTLLIALYGEGKTRGMISELRIAATFNQALGALVFCESGISIAPFVKQYLVSSYAYLRRQAAGGMQPNLNLSIVKQISIPLPPLDEQLLIVAEVAEKLSQIDAAEVFIERSLLRAARLRQSILKQAFEGKLVPQDPTDEPARVLLARIQSSPVAKGRARSVEKSPS